MGIVSRHAGAPYLNGETLSGTDLETDFDNIYDEFNGGIDNDNVSPTADISGSKLLVNSVAGTKLTDNTVTNAKMLADTVTTAKMAASAVPKGYVSSATGSGTALAGGTTFEDVPGITSATMTAGSTSDLIMLDFSGSLIVIAGAKQYAFGFSVNGTDTPDLAVVDLPDSQQIQIHAAWAVAAPATTAIVLKPRIRRVSGTGGSALYYGPTAGGVTRVFRVLIVPTK